MGKSLTILIGLVILLLVGASCNSTEKECTDAVQTAKPLNPNGDSELAILMREMFEEAERMKQQIENEEPVTLSLDHEKILTAHATEPEKAASPEYQAFAEAYLLLVNSFEKAPPARKASLFNDLVENCMNCHEALCPGPMRRIKKLY